MSGVALFGLKYPSLLQFNEDANSLAHNLKQLYGIKRVPSDTSFRERLDPVEATELQRGISRYEVGLSVPENKPPTKSRWWLSPEEPKYFDHMILTFFEYLYRITNNNVCNTVSDVLLLL